MSQSDNWRIGETLERLMARARPESEFPARYRYKCLACEDTGVEAYVHPEYPALCYARPCTHCDEGKIVFKHWTRPPDARRKKEAQDRGGPWYGMDPDMVERIMARSCAHDPLM